MKFRPKTNVEKYLLPRDATVKMAIKQMKEAGEKVIFVIDQANILFGSISDGDIRKWILSEQSLDAPVDKVCNRSPKSVNEGYDLEDVKNSMLDLKIESIPVLTSQLKIVDVLVWDKVFRNGITKPKGKIAIPVVIMAGGKGSRLDPFTKVLPKALIPIGEQTIIEMIMSSFHEYSVTEFYLSINHKASLIKAYLMDRTGSYNITYLEEDKPLGTAGSLKFLLRNSYRQFFVTNCDIIVETDLSEIVAFHNAKAYDMTLVVSYTSYVIPYGICTISNGGLLDSIKEKPVCDLLVNTGMYLINRPVLELIPDNDYFDIPDLIKKAMELGFRVGVFPVDDKSWSDIGQWEEYRKAIGKFSGDRIH